SLCSIVKIFPSGSRFLFPNVLSLGEDDEIVRSGQPTCLLHHLQTDRTGAGTGHDPTQLVHVLQLADLHLITLLFAEQRPERLADFVVQLLLRRVALHHEDLLLELALCGLCGLCLSGWFLLRFRVGICSTHRPSTVFAGRYRGDRFRGVLLCNRLNRNLLRGVLFDERFGQSAGDAGRHQEHRKQQVSSGQGHHG
uniref:Uncharacterized protein n=1 Tax=Anopheles atroparvus TaxID=41427 RepID=A0AAG5D8S6_ANOAO